MEQLKEKLLLFKRKTIKLEELEKLTPQQESYQVFADDILALEACGILTMMPSKGRNPRSPSLAYHYRIKKSLLNESYYKELQNYRIKLHNDINLDYYFKSDIKTWRQNLPYLEKINQYIEAKGFPVQEAPAPERSFELVGNEKWIEEGGEEVLQRIQLWDKLKIMPVADPLMFAVNPNQMDAAIQRHLIVENKTTYQALLPALTSSSFATLIYGSGNKVVKSIENFHNQFPVEADHRFFYFGDLDREGIAIWHRLHQKQTVTPALAFYGACLKKQAVLGKTNQTKNKGAIQAFIAYFPDEQAQRIQRMLEEGAYYPQEVLKTEELQEIYLDGEGFTSF